MPPGLHSRTSHLRHGSQDIRAIPEAWSQVTRFDVHSDAFRSTCMGVWHWLWDGFHEIDFSQPFRCDTLDVTLMWLCFPTFETLRRFFLKFHDLYLIDQMINLFSRPLLETNLYHHLISWIGFCGLSVAAAMGSSSGFRSKFAWTRVRCCSIEPQGQQSLNHVRLVSKRVENRSNSAVFEVLAMFAEIFMTASLAINVLVLVSCLSFSWKDAALKRPWHIYEKSGQRQRHYGSPAIETYELSISPGNINFSCCLGERIAACHHVSCSARFLRCLFAMVFTPMASAWRQCMDQRHRQEESWRQFTRILAARPSSYPGRWYNLFVSFDELRGS